jgi:hypothetical protein
LASEAHEDAASVGGVPWISKRLRLRLIPMSHCWPGFSSRGSRYGSAGGMGARLGLSICIGLGWRRTGVVGRGRGSKLSIPGSRIEFCCKGGALLGTTGACGGGPLE